MGRKGFPGQNDRQLFGTLLEFRTSGGSLDNQLFSFLVMGTTMTEIDGSPAVKIAVRPNDDATVYTAQLWAVDGWVAKTTSYAESREYARRLAGSWHMEYFVFDQWVKGQHWWDGKQPWYRFHHATALTATTGDSRWHVTESSRALPAPPSYKLAPGTDRWDRACQLVESTADVFRAMLGLVPAGTLADRFTGPAKAVEASRSEARRLAAAGRELEKVPRPGDDLLGRIEAIAAQIDDLCTNVQAAVSYMAELSLTVPTAGETVSQGALGALELQALSAAVGEVRALLP